MVQNAVSSMLNQYTCSNFIYFLFSN